jgi:coproporphyrinogen III oxidase-like Fe-S oxidoreductase
MRFPITRAPAPNPGVYAGVGPGAHGRLSLNGRRMASQAERLPERWLAEVERKGSSLSLTEISPAEAAKEHLLMALRLSEGIDLAEFRSRWGIAPYPSRITALCDSGLISFSNNRLAATKTGRLLLNRIITELADMPG